MNRFENSIFILESKPEKSHSNPKEKNAKIKIKEYFDKNKSLTKDNFDNFISFIGLKEIWSTEEEQKFLWDSISIYAVDKKNIDYEAALCGINDLFEEEENDEEELLKNKSSNLIDINNDLYEEENGNNCIDEFLIEIKGNQNFIHQLRMFNGILLEKYFNDENEINVNKNEIIEFFQNKFSFIEVNNEIFDKYLKYFKINNLNSNNNNYYDLNIKKNIIKYVNTILGMNIKEANYNLLSQKEASENINIDLNEEINKLQKLDNHISNCIKSIISFSNNKDFIEIINDYIEKYIFVLKQNIYNSLHKSLIKNLSNKQTLNTILQITNNTSFEIINDSILKITNEENNLLKQKKSQRTNFDNSLITPKKENNINKNEVQDLSLNINNLFITDRSNNISFSESSVRSISKMDSGEINDKMQTTQTKNVKFQLPFSNCKYKNSENDSKILSCKKNNKQSNFRAQMLKNGNSDSKSTITANSYYDPNEDITNSHLDLFSVNGCQDQFLLETTHFNTENGDNEIENEENGKVKKDISTLLKKESCKIEKKLSNENSEDEEDNNTEEYDNYNGENVIKSNVNNNKNNSNKDSIKLQTNDLNDFCVTGSRYSINNFTFGSPNRFVKQQEKNEKNNENDIYTSSNRVISNFYDFKYIANNHKIKKILSQNKDKYFPFLSADVNIIFNKNKNKKQKVILIISSNNIYVINSNDKMEIIYKISHKKIKYIVTAEKNFNLLYLGFNDGIQVIIETYQRIEILIFLKSIILNNKEAYNKIKYSSSDNFLFKKKNEEEIIHTKKNKIFNLTPNLENAQKAGVLFKYQENFFTGSFTKKFVVLCSIGLIYYDDIEKQPKGIIPIIGTSIKFFNINAKEKIYCFKMRTVNDETHVFGALTKNETFDWIKELNYYRSLYRNKMKEIGKFFSEIGKENTNDN